MPIITPAYPAINSTHNVSISTKRVYVLDAHLFSYADVFFNNRPVLLHCVLLHCVLLHCVLLHCFYSLEAEFKRGLEIMNEIFVKPRDKPLDCRAGWNKLLEHSEFFLTFRNYLAVNAVATSAKELLMWMGWVKSKLRHLMTRLARTPNMQVRLFPDPFDAKNPARPFANTFYVGLHFDTPITSSSSSASSSPVSDAKDQKTAKKDVDLIMV
jgi:poly(A) polymerase